jgi:seryl-tRNA synthetase
MLTIQLVRENFDGVVERLKKRNLQDEHLALVSRLLELDDARKKAQFNQDEILSELNQRSKKIGELFKSGKREEAQEEKQAVAEIKEEGKKHAELLKSITSELEEILLTIPNVPHESVPAGNTDEDNEVVKDWAKPFPALPEGHLPHWDLAKKYDIIDFELGTKITGAGFPVYVGKGARLERALINFFLDEGFRAGYKEYIPPLVVNSSSARATGQLPDKEGQMYHVTVDDLYLIPTAEVPLTNIFRDEIIDKEKLPIKITGYTPCFRREAGSYGSHVKGLNRLHQFDKVEIVQIAEPSSSYAILDEMVNHVENILVKLELPYRILRLCGGDLGFTAALTFDFEVYSASQKRWLEVSSVSNFESFQSNRLKLRYRDDSGQKQLAHTLNGSALALARIVAALLENNQTGEGIKIPDVLVPYTKFEFIN